MAQLSKTVTPLAHTDDNRAFSVAPTEILGNLILCPINPFDAEAYI